MFVYFAEGNGRNAEEIFPEWRATDWASEVKTGNELFT